MDCAHVCLFEGQSGTLWLGARGALDNNSRVFAGPFVLSSEELRARGAPNLNSRVSASDLSRILDTTTAHNGRQSSLDEEVFVPDDPETSMSSADFALHLQTVS